MENFVDLKFSRDGQAIKAAITIARSMNVSVLPANLRNKLIAGLDKADQAFNAIQWIRSTERDVAEAGDAYRPVLARVRALERDIRKIDAELAQLDIETSRVGQALAINVEKRYGAAKRNLSPGASPLPKKFHRTGIRCKNSSDQFWLPRQRLGATIDEPSMRPTNL